MPINVASTFSKFVYHKSCVNPLRFQNVYRPSRRPIPSLLDLKEKSTGHLGVSTKETDLFDLHDQCKGQKRLQFLAFVEQKQIARIKGMRIPLNLE